MKLFHWNTLVANKTQERRFIITLCILAMVRVFIFSAAFPFFNNVDEEFHYDTLVKYSKGLILQRDGEGTIGYWQARMIALYGTQEYHNQKMEGREFVFLPSIQEPQVVNYLQTITDYWSTQKNIEITSPPVYYLLAGVWYSVGDFLGLKGGGLLYWIRFFDVGIYGLLVWFAYIFCKAFIKTQPAIWLGVPMILVSFPQDIFYSINSDVLSPLFILLSMYMIFLLSTFQRTFLFHVATGLTIAATVLIKLTNIPVLLLCSIPFILRKDVANRGWKYNRLYMVTLLGAIILPLALWLGWNLYAFGDFTGTADKLRILGWTKKPLSEWFHHSIFTLHGIYIFFSELIKTFWRGEFIWGTERIASNWADWFYVGSSCLCIIASMTGMISARENLLSISFFSKVVNLVILTAFVLILIVLSLQYDFGNCQFPSREYPYFTSGRLISGGIIPFLIIYVDGLIFLISKIRLKINPLVIIIGINVFVLISEIVISSMVFKSAYNWFHLL